MSQVLEALESKGFGRHYLTSLSMFNVWSSPIFFVIYAALYFFLGGWIVFFISASVALVVTFALHYFVVSPRLAIPADSAVVLTGCSTGIGFETAQALANKGFTVFATVRKAEHFEKLKNAIANQAAKNRLVMVLLDVTDTAQVAAAAQQVKAELQKRKLHLQSLINNAGYAAPGPLEIIPAAAARAQFDTNVFGAISVTNAFAPLLRESKSKIAPSVINITSVVAEIVPPGLALYAASKHAFHAITVGYRMELSAWGINVVEVQPGSIKTSFVDTVKLGYNSNVAIDESKQDEVLMHYSKVGSKFLEDAELMANKMSSGPAVVAGVIEEALRTNRPLATYRCGKDAHVTLPLGNIAPWAIDLVGKFTFKKRN